MVNPSPYMIYLQARGSILVASSPEILCRVGEDRLVTNRRAHLLLPQTLPLEYSAGAVVGTHNDTSVVAWSRSLTYAGSGVTSSLSQACRLWLQSYRYTRDAQHVGKYSRMPSSCIVLPDVVQPEFTVGRIITFAGHWRARGAAGTHQRRTRKMRPACWRTKRSAPSTSCWWIWAVMTSERCALRRDHDRVQA